MRLVNSSTRKLHSEEISFSVPVSQCAIQAYREDLSDAPSLSARLTSFVPTPLAHPKNESEGRNSS